MHLDELLEFRVGSVGDRNQYKLLAGLIVPRPIAWVTTHSSGVTNLAPFSFFQVISYRIPRVGLAFERRQNGNLKDTHAGILTGAPFAISIPQAPQITEVHLSGTDYPFGISEAEALGIPLARIHDWSIPVVSNSMAALLCELETNLDLGEGESWISARVLSFSVRQEAFDEHMRLNYSVFRPLGRLIGDLYVDATNGILSPDKE